MLLQGLNSHAFGHIANNIVSSCHSVYECQMTYQRRFIPTTSALIAFEAVARNGSFTRAAEEMALTQSAVSRQVRALEEQLDCVLFERGNRQVSLTDAGRRYATEISKALMTIRDASIQVSGDGHNQVLNLAILPTFGTRWLMPRIPRFVARHPGITLKFATRIGRFDFAADGLDAAIYHGLPDWPGVRCTLMMREVVVPVASPEFVARNPCMAPADLLKYPRLAMKSRPDAWRKWFESNGIEARDDTGMSFEQFSTVAQACIGGMGVALMPEMLITRELDMRELVPVGKGVLNDEAYYFAEPVRNNPSRAAEHFRQWLLDETGSKDDDERRRAEPV
jgi:DNA-binding transcriptional LysR family regulator